MPQPFGFNHERRSVGNVDDDVRLLLEGSTGSSGDRYLPADVGAVVAESKEKRDHHILSGVVLRLEVAGRAKDVVKDGLLVLRHRRVSIALGVDNVGPLSGVQYRSPRL